MAINYGKGKNTSNYNLHKGQAGWLALNRGLVITNLRVDLRLKFYYEPSVEEVVQECLGPGVPATRLLDTAR